MITASNACDIFTFSHPDQELFTCTKNIVGCADFQKIFSTYDTKFSICFHVLGNKPRLCNGRRKIA